MTGLAGVFRIGIWGTGIYGWGIGFIVLHIPIGAGAPSFHTVQSCNALMLIIIVPCLLVVIFSHLIRITIVCRAYSIAHDQL
jgi:hypothetical protein